jgi:Alr-MurF fusion protein
MNNLAPVAMRLELKEGINNCSIINDSYNSDVNSLSIALDFLNQQKQHRKRTLILSDILQSGKNEHELYSFVADLIREKGVDHLIGIGEIISKQSVHFDIEQKHFFKSTQDFLRYFPLADFQNETILLKGARIFEFEIISKALQHKAHETVLEINLNGLVSNLNFFKGLMNPDTGIMVMVKAFSYGNGSYEIANILQFHRVDYLAVAYADEGVELRRAGIGLPIMVMSPEEQSMDSLITYNLEPEIYSFRILKVLTDILHGGYHSSEKAFPIHIKLDTGMHRLGFTPSQLPELIDTLKQFPEIFVKTVFSHLAASDVDEQRDFTLQQIAEFDSMSSQIIASLDYPVKRHILNSAGISRYPQAQFDMVRLGIGLYGIATDPNHQASLCHIGRLKTTITQIKDITVGQSVSYNRSFVATKTTRIAIIPIGYSDGLNRALGNGNGKVLINNTFANVIGSICMDMSMIDITGLNANEGDEVIIFGPEYPITEIAHKLNTIPYEVLTGVSRRVKRVYYHE